MSLTEDFDVDATVEDKRQKLYLHMLDVIEELKEEVRPYDLSGKVQKHIERVFCYNVADLDGRLFGGIGSVVFYESYVPKEEQTEEKRKLAMYLGCLTEMLKAVAYMVDDVIDGGVTRRKKLCWYKLEDVKLNAINDAFMLEATVYALYKKHFSQFDFYHKIIELYREATFVGSIGEYLDSNTIHQDFTTFTMDQFKRITKLKTIHICHVKMLIEFTFCGVTDQKSIDQALSCCTDIAYFCQFQNDFTDCYGDPKVIGKVGTDIEEGKCTWLAAKFLELATPAQKEIFKKNYGKADPAYVKRIKQLYDEVSMVDICVKYEEETHKELRKNPILSQKLFKGFSHLLVKLDYLRACRDYKKNLIAEDDQVQEKK